MLTVYVMCVCSWVDSDAIGYFRAIADKEEYSERALDVTLRVIKLNPAHYTVW
jgi:protein farnesyltransferase/geranylgeranyltransferase type-1 subunit alpha